MISARRLRHLLSYLALAMLAALLYSPRNAELMAMPGTSAPPGSARAQEDCIFTPGFEELRQLIPDLVGECLENEHPDGQGNVVQQTTGGMLVYRPADNWTAFTDGLTTWINGPCGLDSRPNGTLLAWEQGGSCQASGFGFLPDAPLPALALPVRCAVVYMHEVPSRIDFEAMIGGLLRRGYTFVTVQALAEAMAGGPPLPRLCIVLSLDDGLMSQYENAKPVLDAYRVPAIFFLMPAFNDGAHRYMRAQEIRAISDAGYEIGGHTLNHARLPNLRLRNPPAFQSEIVDSRSQLEQITGRPVHFFAYPDGSNDPPTAAEIGRVGYWMGFTTTPGTLMQPANRLTLPRIQTQGTYSADGIIRAISPYGG